MFFGFSFSVTSLLWFLSFRTRDTIIRRGLTVSWPREFAEQQSTSQAEIKAAENALVILSAATLISSLVSLARPRQPESPLFFLFLSLP